MPYQLLHYRHDLLFIHERHLDIYLGELGLPVCPKIFIPETLGKLVVAVDPADGRKSTKGNPIILPVAEARVIVKLKAKP